MREGEKLRLSRRLKFITVNLILAAALAFILNINLPPNQVNGHLAADADRSFLRGMPVAPEEGGEDAVLHQNFAGWVFDERYVVVKYARSDRLKVTLVGYPFMQWNTYSLD